MKKLSITMKITIWYTVFMFIIAGVFVAALTYTGSMRAGELARTRLMDSVVDAVDEIETVKEDFIIDDDLEFYDDGVYISVYDEDKELIEGRRPAELSELPELRDTELEKLESSDGETWYVYDRMFDMNGRDIWVRGIVKDFAESGSVAAMLRIAAVAFPALVIFAALGGYVITRRGFGPVRNILRTVGEISRDGDLSRRIVQDKEPGSPKDEIYNLSETFNGMFGRLEETFEKEKQFTSDVSHELRTPLSVIISQSDYAIEDEEYREKALKVINREAKRMAGLVSRLLTLARSDAGRLKLDRELVDLSSLCETVAWQQEEPAAKRNIKIHSEISPGITVCGDEAMLIRVLLNLMDNAVKYGKDGGNVELSLSQSDDMACFKVRDDGIGIGQDDLPKIWERFYRVDGSRSEDSAGLGLSMVEAIVKAHGGHVEAESVLHEGSCFTVMIPVWRKDNDNQ